MTQTIEEQLVNYQGYLQQDPENTRLRIETANLYLTLGRLEEASQTVEAGLRQEPGHPELEFTQATIAIASNQPDQAVTILNQLLERGIDNPGVRYNLAFSLALIEQYDHAKEVLDSAPAPLDPHLPETALLRARIQHHLGEVDEAISSATDLVHKHPDHPKVPEATGLLALLYLDKGADTEAKAYAKQSLATQPSNPESLVTMGNLSLSEFETEQSDKYFEQVLSQDQNNGRGWLGKGLLNLMTNNFPAAEEALKKAVSLMPSHLGTWNALAWCQIMRGKLNEAEASLQEALSIDRNFGETHGGLAVIAVLRNQPELADEHLKRGLGLNRESFAANYARSLLLEKEGKHQTSEKLIQQLFQTPIGQQQKTVKQALDLMTKKTNSSSQDNNNPNNRH